MVIWLRNPRAEGAGFGVGADDDVLRAGDLATLVEVDAECVDLNRLRDEALEAARAEAQAIVDAAQAEADAIRAAAQHEYDGAAARGYDDGFAQGLSDWQERALRSHAAAQTIGRRRRDRLAQLVSLAVEQIVASADPAELFARAAKSVEQIVADGSPVQFAVHPADLAAATAAFDAAARGWREAGIAVRLLARGDATLERGACVIETDLGALDASLPLQLAAMRGALARAVRSVPESEFEDEPVEANGGQPMAGRGDGERNGGGNGIGDDHGGDDEHSGVGDTHDNNAYGNEGAYDNEDAQDHNDAYDHEDAHDNHYAGFDAADLPDEATTYHDHAAPDGTYDDDGQTEDATLAA
ncbi:type III secretion system stator protein SctL [Paraburkholderia sp. Cy-641]|uniref:type III secretion system stator protein SctL n=1 Tax=Paraburkholderia sp. Cy-641 TaxID=2608337 RepID=UPI001965C265|nr:type III secretion system stator protein SctL [Paraburkholderia sp. Cy-641]